MTTKFDLFKQKKAEYEKLIADEGKNALVESFKALFDAVPELESINWKQYTPFFNDGDTCTFSVHDFDVATFNVPVKEQEYKGYKEPGNYRSEAVYEDVVRAAGDEVEDISYHSNKLQDPTLEKLAEALKLLNSVRNSCEDVFEAAFGDHVRVTATRKGFDTEEIDHD